MKTSEHTPLRQAHASTRSTLLTYDEAMATSHAPTPDAARAPDDDDPLRDDATPSASFRRWPRRKGWSLAFVALAVVMLAGATMYAVEPFSERTSSPAPATTATPTATPSAASTASTANARSTVTTTSGTSGGSSESVVGWEDVLGAPGAEEPTTEVSVDGDPPSDDSSASAPTEAPTEASTSDTSAPPPPVELSLATRHEFTISAFATGVIEKCAKHATAASCAFAREKYGCAWIDSNCIVDCGTFTSEVGCSKQGLVCAFNADTGRCVYPELNCAAYTTVQTCTQPGCGWLDGQCYDERNAQAACAAHNTSAACTTNVTGSVGCLWTVPDTIEMGSTSVYVGSNTSVTDVSTLRGHCLVRNRCGEFRTAAECETHAPMCAFNAASGECNRVSRVAENHALCSPRSTESEYQTCAVNATTGETNFCNMVFNGRAGFCQRCSSFPTNTSCNALPFASSRQRCVAKCHSAPAPSPPEVIIGADAGLGARDRP